MTLPGWVVGSMRSQPVIGRMRFRLAVVRNGQVWEWTCEHGDEVIDLGRCNAIGQAQQAAQDAAIRHERATREAA